MGWKDAPVATDEDLGEQPQGWRAAPPAEEDYGSRELDYDKLMYAPTVGMKAPQRIAAGAGKRMTDVWLGIKELLGQATPEEQEAKAKLDEPLAYTKEGKIGGMVADVGMTMPLSMLPGARTATGAGLYGGAYGGIQPAKDWNERLKNMLLFGGMSAGTTAGANKLVKESMLAGGRGTTTPSIDLTRQAITKGYNVPPQTSNPSLLNWIMESLPGKTSVAQSASLKNQPVTNNLVKQYFTKSGYAIPDDRQLSSAVLQNIRQQAGTKYEAVKNAVRTFRPDRQFFRDLKSIDDNWGAAAKDFPLITRKGKQLQDILDDLRRPEFNMKSTMDLVKGLRNQASRGLRGSYDPEKYGLAIAQRRAADAIEDLVERRLQSVDPNLMPAYKEARRIIAATYDVGSALNDSTGNISAHRLGVLLDKGKPLTDELKFVAQFSNQFPKATARPEQIGSLPMASPLDWYGAGGAAVLTGQPAALAAPTIRPGARGLALSKPYQNVMGMPKDVLSLQDLTSVGNISKYGIPLSQMLRGIPSYLFGREQDKKQTTQETPEYLQYGGQ